MRNAHGEPVNFLGEPIQPGEPSIPFEEDALAAARVPAGTGNEEELDLVIPDARMDAFIAISGEREYQDRNYPNKPVVSAAVILIEEYLQRAKTSLVFGDPMGAACAFRKIAALAVRSMEAGGSVSRAEEDE